MIVRVAAAFVLLVLSAPLFACSFCGDGFSRRQPLRERFAEAKVVIAGVLKNPVARDDGTGTTEFHITHVLKADAALGKSTTITIPRYLPVVADTPPDYLFFCSVVDGKVEPTHGIPGSKATTEYLASVAKLDPNAVEKRLGFFFQHLDSPDPTVSGDAFVEFARASDADIVTAKASLDRKKIRAWIADPKTPEERIGVFGLMLGLCGDKADAEWLHATLRAAPPTERVSANLGGLLCGLILLTPEPGWKLTAEVLASPTRGFSDKLNAISAVRFFQATRPKESKDQILTCLKVVVANNDLADLAIDDLRRWGWWDLTPTVLGQYAKHTAPSVRRGVVRYALQCPDEAAKQFVADVRTTDPMLVKKVEDGLKLYEKK